MVFQKKCFSQPCDLFKVRASSNYDWTFTSKVLFSTSLTIGLIMEAKLRLLDRFYWQTNWSRLTNLHEVHNLRKNYQKGHESSQRSPKVTNSGLQRLLWGMLYWNQNVSLTKSQFFSVIIILANAISVRKVLVRCCCIGLAVVFVTETTSVMIFSFIYLMVFRSKPTILAWVQEIM